jgi:cytochrome b involved in lipid metabolism
MNSSRVYESVTEPKDLAGLKIISRSTIYQLIAKGHLIVIANSRVYRLDDWLTRHPGGALTIKHMVGRDATDEINRYTNLHDYSK